MKSYGEKTRREQVALPPAVLLVGLSNYFFFVAALAFGLAAAFFFGAAFFFVAANSLTSFPIRELLSRCPVRRPWLMPCRDLLQTYWVLLCETENPVLTRWQWMSQEFSP